MTQEYIVTLKSYEDLDNFYDDMETHGGNECIPTREVHCCCRRSISRNTHYHLNEEEAVSLKNDPRVIDVVPKSILDQIQIRPRYSQTSSNWDKSSSAANTQNNWALLRCVNGSQISNWGSNGTTNQSGTINVTSSGKNVDVVIVDGHLNPNHPEFAVNSDGTGGSRVIQYNWYQHTAELGYGSNGTYVYPTGTNLENASDNHGMHVAGTVAGNTQGWARDANIYNLSPYSNNPNTLASSYEFDYIRAWHNSKSVNPNTGIKNPTICNNSWGSFYQILKSDITSVYWRGTSYTSGLTNDATLDIYGLVDTDTNYVYVDAWLSSLIADVTDAIADGILFVGAAGNANMVLDSSGGTDYNNYIVWQNAYFAYYQRGSWNVVGGNSICVGAISALVDERKASFSQKGSRVDIYAPGDNIISCLHDGTVTGGSITTVTDTRDSNYVLGKYDGTSMASPQVCGILACALEQYPRMTQAEAVEYITSNSKSNQMYDSGSSSYTDYYNLFGSDNNYLFYKKERPDDGALQPRETFKNRPSSGQVFPRRSTLHYSKS